MVWGDDVAGRIRSIKPEWLENERLARCSSDARLLSVALIVLADDHGNGRGSVEYLRAQVWAYSRDPRETLAKVSERVASALAELENADYVVMYAVSGQSYFHLPGWARHQRVDKIGKARVPLPSDEARESSRESRETRAPDQEKGTRRREKGSVRAREIPRPDDWEPDETAKALAAELKLNLDHEAAEFRDWTTAKSKLYADWQAGFRSHLRSQAKRGPQPHANGGGQRFGRPQAEPPTYREE